MKTSVLFNTKFHNYNYNSEKMLFHYLHPIVNYFISKQESNEALDISKIKFDGFLSNYTKEEIYYYYKKYLYFKEHGIFSDKKRDSLCSGRLSGDLVRNQIANIKQIVFEVTDKCNLKCKYCGYGEYYEFYDERNGINMDFKKARSLLVYFIKLWESYQNISYKKNIYISFYGGEPLLNFPFIEKIVNFINGQKSPTVPLEIPIFSILPGILYLIVKEVKLVTETIRWI